ncbi:MAG: outer membrane protein transport protein [Gammaproteobacteria bacterium]|nr:outer membrane protein transport protein [Gammaproteobacteria bacterium]MDE2349559.1 outer membrane protein transport protein [Gammaproteobacteria bacterium]
MKSFTFLAWILMPLAFCGAAHATNGYFTDGAGTKSEGLAGAGSADPHEVMVIATNPAGLAFVGRRVEAGVGLFSPDRSYSTSPSLANGQGGAFTIGPNDINSGNKLFPMPYVAADWRLDAQDFLGAAFYARGGMNTVWQGGTATFQPGPGAPVTTFPGTYGAGTAGVDLMQAFINVSLAHASIDRKVSVGASAIVAAQRFVARGLANFAPYTQTFAASGGTVMPAALSNAGADMSYGAGASLGVEWRPTPQWGAALAYTSKIYMSKFKKYSDLFAGDGGFDIPANATVGLTFKPTPPVAVSFDVQRIWYSKVSSIGNPIGNLFACPTAGAGGTDLTSCLGGQHGPGFGWRDMTVYKLGLSWDLDTDWTGRVGFSHGTQPIPASQTTFNILAPGVIENHVAVGFTHRHGDNGELSFAFTYAPEKTISGANTFDPTQTITLKMHQYIMEFGYAWMP